ncbi:MAG: hypothetical protein Q4E91_08290 [Lachnospiraceae bacterium]|nr:hypothetical protein [Lachnospiraceae bacterium]
MNLEYLHFKTQASTMQETTYVKLCAYGRIMKLPKAVRCQFPAAGRNEK